MTSAGRSGGPAGWPGWPSRRSSPRSCPSGLADHVDDVRVALVGFGLAGRVFHAPLVAAATGCTLSAVVTGNPERQAAVRASYPSTRVVGSTDELFAVRDAFDLVVVATTNDSHAP